MTDIDPYAVLGVRPGATGAEITAAYRRRVMATHPDRAGGSGASFKAVKEAYQRLRTGPGSDSEPPARPQLAPRLVDFGPLLVKAGTCRAVVVSHGGGTGELSVDRTQGHFWALIDALDGVETSLVVLVFAGWAPSAGWFEDSVVVQLGDVRLTLPLRLTGITP